MVIADVDRFKCSNDRFGHPLGDRVLQAVGEALTGSLRGGDAVFAVERLRAAVRAVAIPGPAGSVEVTASFGVAGCIPGAEDTPARQYATADEALYAAKNGGRDPVRLGARAAAPGYDPSPVEARMRILALVALAACSDKSGDNGDDGETDLPVAAACDAPGFTEPVVPAARWERTTTPDGQGLIRWIPENPRGLVFYFHGTGGNYDDVMYVEPTREMDTLIRAGFGFVSTESEERGGSAQWEKGSDDWRENPDLERLEGLYEDLVAAGDITRETPILTTGFSDGGAMSGFFSAVAKVHGWPVFAAAMHNSGGSSSADIPQIWVIAENETDQIGPNSLAAYENAVADGAIATYHLAAEEPLVADRLLRIPRFTQEDADLAFADLVKYGILDEAGVRVIDLDTQLESSLNKFEKDSKVQQDWEVSTQLRVVWSTHRFNSEYSQEVCEHFTTAIDSP